MVGRGAHRFGPAGGKVTAGAVRSVPIVPATLTGRRPCASLPIPGVPGGHRADDIIPPDPCGIRSRSIRFGPGCCPTGKDGAGADGVTLAG